MASGIDSDVEVWLSAWPGSLSNLGNYSGANLSGSDSMEPF